MSPPARPTQAMVLAAGLGVRMRPLTSERPKPALPVLNRPLIAFVLEHLAAHGVTLAVVNSHHLPEILEREAGRWAPPGMRVRFSRECTILGTAGGLKKAQGQLEPGPLYLYNSDSLTEADLTAAAAAHAASGRLATMVVRPHDPTAGYKPVGVASGSPTGRVASIAGRRWDGEPSEPRTFIGVHVLEPAVLEAIPEGRACDINSEIYPMLLDRDRGSVGAWRDEGWWFEAGVPARYLDLNLELLERSGQRVSLGRGSAWDGTARVERSCLGAGCRLEAGCVVEECVLWDDVTVGAGTSLRRCVVTSGAVLPPARSYGERIIVGRGSAAPEILPLATDGAAVGPSGGSD